MSSRPNSERRKSACARKWLRRAKLSTRYLKRIHRGLALAPSLTEEQNTMKLIDSLIKEFDHEAQTTRKHLERLPEDKLDWRPHEKSFTAGGLAAHITEMVSWTDAILDQDELDFYPASHKPYRATSVADLLKTFDDNVAKGKQA